MLRTKKRTVVNQASQTFFVVLNVFDSLAFCWK